MKRLGVFGFILLTGLAWGPQPQPAPDATEVEAAVRRFYGYISSYDYAALREASTPDFEPSAQSISNWVVQADRDAGKRTDGLATAERDELSTLRRENRQLKVEREILSKAAAWFAQETAPNSKRSSGSCTRTRPPTRFG